MSPKFRFSNEINHQETWPPPPVPNLICTVPQFTLSSELFYVMSGWQFHTVGLSGILHTLYVVVPGWAVYCMVAIYVSLLGLWGRCALKGRCLIKTILLLFHRGHLKGQWYFHITSTCMRDSWPTQLTFMLTHAGVRAGLSRPIPHFTPLMRAQSRAVRLFCIIVPNC